MKLKVILFIFFMFSIINVSISQNTLTKKERIKDFNSLYKELKASYPYFGVNKRQNDID